MSIINIINEGQFWDYKNDEFVCFVDDEKEEEIELYFLYYEIGENTFHQPIKNPEKYDLKTVKLDDFYTEGNDINDLLSVQFCDKVYKGLMDGSLQIKEEIVAI